MKKRRREWLINFRNKKGFTQEQVAFSSQIKRAYYTQIELGIRQPSVMVAKRIATTLDFPWTIFFENECSEREQIKRYSVS